MATNNTVTVPLNKLTCPVCCDRFKVPKVLQCGHSFCQTCVQQLLQSNPVSCPVCRKEFTTWDKTAEQFPTIYVLQSLVDSFASPFDEETLSRSFGQCPSHEDDCDQFCRTCEKQMCKQCIIDHHQGPSHDSSSVGAVVVQQREDLDKLVTELNELMNRLKLIDTNITESEKTCQSEVDQLMKNINASAAEYTNDIVNNAESLRVVVEEENRQVLQYIENIKSKHSESYLLAFHCLDLCQSLQSDLDKNNLSRFAVMKKLDENKSKIENELKNLEEKENARKIEYKFQYATIKAKAGKLESKKGSIPVASYMKRVSFTDDEAAKTDDSKKKADDSSTKPDDSSSKPDVSSKSSGSANIAMGRRRMHLTRILSSCSKYQQPTASEPPAPTLLGFVWPTPNWMIGLKLQTTGSHTFVKFTNLHFLKATFHHEIGVDKKWLYVSQSDHEGKFILCFSSERVHKFSLSLKQNLQEPGQIVSTVFTPMAILGIAWDEHHHGCYVLLTDKKMLLRVTFEGPEGFEEVTEFEQEITSCQNTQFFHVNEDGGMTVCDHEKKVIHFFEKIESKPTVTVTAPPGLNDYTPECVNSRRGEKLWYVMWRNSRNRPCEMKLYVYDSSFHLIGPVRDLCINAGSSKSRVMFYFQGDYIAVTIDDMIEVYVLS